MCTILRTPMCTLCPFAPLPCSAGRQKHRGAAGPAHRLLIAQVTRSVIWGFEETTPLTSLLLGSIAGFVAGLAYLVPQYVGKYGVLDPAATKVEATDKIQFVSAALVAISADVGFDTVFTRLKIPEPRKRVKRRESISACPD
jgi:hypothetical protein